MPTRSAKSSRSIGRGISAALRTVWLRSMREPGTALTALARLNTTPMEDGDRRVSDAGNRWMGTVPAEGHAATRSADKRFARPEWQEQPGLPHAAKRATCSPRTGCCIESDHLTDIDEAEKQRINFHLRQFVDAMSPSLLLLSNPAALKRAMETGGASLAEGAATWLATSRRAG